MTNQEKWVEFCAQHDNELCIYDKPFWLDAVCNGRENWDVFLVEENDEITAALPFYVKKRMGLRLITMPLLTQHNGIWMKRIANEKSEKRISREYKLFYALIEQIEAQKVTVYQQCYSPQIKNWQPFFWSGYMQKTLYTFIVDCADGLEKAEKNFSAKTRKNIRKAMQLGTVGELEDLSLFYKLNCMTYARNGHENPIPMSLVQRLYKACKENNAVKMMYAKTMQGDIYGVIFFVYDAMNVYALMSGTVPDKRYYNFHTLLTYEGIKFACETGRNYDFEGSMLEGVANYNLNFGAEMHPYYLVKKVFAKAPCLRRYLKMKLYM